MQKWDIPRSRILEAFNSQGAVHIITSICYFCCYCYLFTVVGGSESLSCSAISAAAFSLQSQGLQMTPTDQNGGHRRALLLIWYTGCWSADAPSPDGSQESNPHLFTAFHAHPTLNFGRPCLSGLNLTVDTSCGAWCSTGNVFGAKL